MVHYYKSLNYLGLGKNEDAMVEARRISLRSFAQQDKAGFKTNKYSDDAFALMLQGIIYELKRRYEQCLHLVPECSRYFSKK